MAMGGGMNYTMIDVGEGTGGGMMKHPMAGAPSAWLAYVRVDNVSAATAKAKSLGATILREVTEVPNAGACHVLVRGRDDTNSYCSIALGRIHVARLRKRERCHSQPRWQEFLQRRVCRRTRAGSATGYSPKPSRRVGAVSQNDGGAFSLVLPDPRPMIASNLRSVAVTEIPPSAASRGVGPQGALF